MPSLVNASTVPKVNRISDEHEYSFSESPVQYSVISILKKSMSGDAEKAGQIKCLLCMYEALGLGPQNPCGS